MSIIVEWNNHKGISIQVKEEDMEVFKELVNRACNCWDKAPATIKTFADHITNKNTSLQDYHNISTSKPRPDQ